ncbi:MAG: hypothetical protein K0S08_264 [Gammaproteobacteria bacterium]|jgi:hypothetical protein|nr:hypothetical protein [Gammaproteobacteria bacterium]
MFSRFHEDYNFILSNWHKKLSTNKRIYQLTAISLLLAILSYIFKYYSNVLLSHWLDLNDYSHYSFFIGIITLVSSIALLGKERTGYFILTLL